ncbi:MAG: hypothetical protein ACXACY_26490 [Candidatus Hodarchaeales archaeon]
MPSVDWNKLKKDTKIIEKATHYETVSGKLITWSSRDSTRAQKHLKRLAKITSKDF